MWKGLRRHMEKIQRCKNKIDIRKYRLTCDTSCAPYKAIIHIWTPLEGKRSHPDAKWSFSHVLEGSTRWYLTFKHCQKTYKAILHMWVILCTKQSYYQHLNTFRRQTKQYCTFEHCQKSYKRFYEALVNYKCIIKALWNFRSQPKALTSSKTTKASMKLFSANPGYDVLDFSSTRNLFKANAPVIL